MTSLCLPDFSNWKKPLKLCQEGKFEELFKIYDHLHSKKLFVDGHNPCDYLRDDESEPDKYRTLFQPIHYAAAFGDISAVRTLVEKYNCTNSPDKSIENATSTTPLLFACYCGHYSIFQYLVDNGSVLKYEEIIGALSSGAGWSCVRDFGITNHEFKELGNIEEGTDHFKILKCVLDIFHDKSKPSGLEIAIKHGEWEDILNMNTIAPEHEKFSPKNNIPSPLFCALICRGNVEILKQILLKCPIITNSQYYINIMLDCFLFYNQVQDNIDIILLVLRFCEKPMFAQYSGEPVFFYIIRCQGSDDNNITEKLIQEFGDQVNSNGENLLHHACRRGCVQIAELLLKEHPHLQNAKDSQLQLPLHITCFSEFMSVSDKIKLIRLMSTNDATSNFESILDSDGYTPLQVACMKKQWNLVQYFVCHKTSPATLNKYFSIMFQNFGCKLFSIDIDFSEVSFGDVDAVYVNGSTALHYACMNFNQKVILHLSSTLHASIGVVNSKGDLPIHIVLKRKSWWEGITPEIVKILCDENNINITDSEGNTPLLLLCKSKGVENFEFFYDVMEYFVCQLKASVEIADASNNCPLHLLTILFSNLATCLCNFRGLMALVCTKSTINSQNDCENTALHIACGSKEQQIKLLLIDYLVKERLASTTVCNNQLDLPVHSYLQHSKKELDVSYLDLLLECTDVNVPNCYGNTPLHYACAIGSEEGVLYLIKSKGALIDIMNKFDRLPLHLLLNHRPLKLRALSKLITNANLLVQDCNGNTPLHVIASNFEMWFSHEHRSCFANQSEFKKHFDQFICVVWMHIAHSPGFMVSSTNIRKVLPCLSIREIAFDLVGRKNKKGISPLQILFDLGYASNMNFLFSLNHNRYNSILCNDLSLAPLVTHNFSSEPNYELFRSLANSRNICNKVSNCATVLHFASQMGSEFISYLGVMISEETINFPDSSGKTPLHIACENRNEKVINLLLEQDGCDCNIQDKFGNTPLHYCAKKGFICNAFRVRIDSSNLHIPNKEGLLPIEEAIQAKKFDLAQYFLDQHSILCEENSNTCDYVQKLYEILIKTVQQTFNPILYCEFECRASILDFLTSLKLYRIGRCKVRHCYELLLEHYECLCEAKLMSIVKSFLDEHCKICDKLLGNCTVQNDFLNALLRDSASPCCDSCIYKAVEKLKEQDEVFFVHCRDSDQKHFNALLHEITNLVSALNNEITMYDQCDQCRALLEAHTTSVDDIISDHRNSCESTEGCRMCEMITNYRRQLSGLISDCEHYKRVAQHNESDFLGGIGLLFNMLDEDAANSKIKDGQLFFAQLACKLCFQESEKFVAVDNDVRIAYPQYKFSLKIKPFSEINREMLMKAAAWYGRTDLLHYLIKDESCDPVMSDCQVLSYACRYSSIDDRYSRLKVQPSKSSILFLLQSGCNIFYQLGKWNPCSLFACVCEEQDFSLLKILTSSCDVINSQDDHGSTPLMILIEVCNKTDSKQYYNNFLYDAMQYLLHDRACDQTLTNRSGMTAYKLACQCNLPKNVVNLFDVTTPKTTAFSPDMDYDTYKQFLATVSPQVTEKIKYCKKLLIYENYKIINLLLQTVSITSIFTDGTILSDEHEDYLLRHYCIEHVHEYEINNQYLHCSEAVDCAGNTLLHLACAYNVLETTKFLITQCTSIGDVLCKKNVFGETPIHLCCSKKSCAVLYFLLTECITREEYSALYMQEKNGKYPLSIALELFIECPTPIDMLKALFLLIELTASKFKKNDLGIFLHQICLYSNAHSCILFDYLIQKGANLKTTDKFGKLALHYAAKVSLDLVRKSIQKQFLNVQDKNGDTALHIACANGKAEIIKYLIIKMHSDVFIENFNKETALHKLCSFNGDIDEEIFELLLQKTKLFTADIWGNYPLHVLCKYFTNNKVNHIKMLVRQLSKKDQMHTISLPNEYLELPLHFLCKSKMKNALLVAKILLPYTRDCNTKTVSGNTPLILACLAERQDILQLLTKDTKCQVSIADENGNLPLHLACNMQVITSNSIANQFNFRPTELEEPGSCFMKSLRVLANENTVNAINKEGNTPLHIFLKNDFLEYFPVLIPVKIIHEFYCQLLKLLLELGAKNSVATSNKMGEFPIHLAYQFHDTSVIEMIGTSGILKLTENEDNVLHCACKFFQRTYDDIKHLLQIVERSQYINKRNQDENLPMHLSCKNHLDFQILKLFLDKGDGDINAKNKEGNTPLHLSPPFMPSCYDDVLKLIDTYDFNMFLTNNANESFLDILAQCGDNDFTETMLLHFSKNLEKLQEIFSLSSNKFLLFLYFSRKPNIVKILLEHNSNPSILYEVHNHLSKNQVKPVHIPVTMFFVGDPMTGKTTLINSLKREAGIKASVDDRRTAGIVSNHFSSDKYGHVSAYDFAGQREYYSSSHDAVMQSIIQQLPPIVVLHVNLEDPEDCIRSEISYWSTVIKNRLNYLQVKCFLIIIFSHEDKLAKPEGFSDKLCKTITSNLLKSIFCSVNGISMDCRDHNSKSMKLLINLLSEITEKVKYKGSLTFNAHCLFVFLNQQWKGKAAIRLGELLTKKKQIEQKEFAGLNEQQIKCLPSNASDLMSLCEELALSDSIVLIKDKFILQRSWIILKKHILLEEVSRRIFFTPMNIVEHLSGTGVVYFSTLKDTFLNFDPNLIISFLQKMEYCYEIKDSYVKEFFKLQKISHENCYFFPHLVNSARPSPLWSNCKSKSVKFGWVLQCQESLCHFTSRFVHILLLRLIFRETQTHFKPTATEPYKDVRSISKVWKSGMMWFNGHDVETIVDVVDTERKVIVLMRCKPDSKFSLFQLRASVMTLVCELSKELCSAISTEQFFIHPSHIEEIITTLEINQCKVVSMSNLCKAIVQKMPAVVTSCGPLATEDFTLVNKDCVITLDQLDCSGDKIPEDFWASLAKISQDCTRLCDKDFNIIYKKLNQFSCEWRDIGTSLGFLPHELSNIEAAPLLLSGAPKSYLRRMLEDWLQWAPHDARESSDYATLGALRHAVREAGLEQVYL